MMSKSYFYETSTGPTNVLLRSKATAGKRFSESKTVKTHIDIPTYMYLYMGIYNRLLISTYQMYSYVPAKETWL